MHSRYQRRLLDLAAAGQETVIQLRVRRFFCLNEACQKVTFAEQVPRLTVRYRRRSPGLTRALQAVALALGGRAGTRLSAALATEVSRATLIRLIRALPDPVPAEAPRVLGVDEFASAAATPTARCLSTLRPAAQPKSSPNGRRTPSPHG